MRRSTPAGPARSFVRALAAGVATVGLVVGFSPIGASGPVSAQTSFTVTGGGWGHGVGLSQYGAKGRAEAGHGADQILAAYYPGAPVETRSLAGPRVKIGEAAITDLSAPGSIYATPDGGSRLPLSNPGERITVQISGTSIVAMGPSGGPVTISTGEGVSITTDGGPLAVSATGRSYPFGQLRLIKKDRTFEMVLVDLSMQQYLYGLGEMPASWPIEALRAQAVAGRSFAAYRLAYPRDGDFDMFASVSDQAYVGTAQTASSSGGRWIEAVDTTDGRVLTSGGRVVQAFYSSSNGGHTERSDYVWVASLPYFRAEPDPFDTGTSNPNASWSRTYTGDELGSWVAAAGKGNVGSVTALSIGGAVGASGRVDKARVTVSGSAGSVTISGNEFRSAVNAGAASARDLLSTKFSLGSATPVQSAPPAPPPPDTTPPDLKVLFGTPMRFGSSGNICAFVLSDEVAIYALHIRLKGIDLRSSVGGVSPASPQFMCINIPPRLRPSQATRVVLTGAALDASVNMRFVQPTVTISR